MHSSQLALVQQLLEESVAGIGPLVGHEPEDQVGASVVRVEKLLAVSNVHRKRLLDEDMDPRLEGGDAEGHVVVVRRRHHQGVHLAAREQVVTAGEPGDEGEGLEPGGVAVADGDERRPRDRPVDEGSSVLGPHASQAHDPESDVGHVRSADRREAC